MSEVSMVPQGTGKNLTYEAQDKFNEASSKFRQVGEEVIGDIAKGIDSNKNKNETLLAAKDSKFPGITVPNDPTKRGGIY